MFSFSRIHCNLVRGFRHWRGGTLAQMLLVFEFRRWVKLVRPRRVGILEATVQGSKLGFRYKYKQIRR